MLHIVMKYVLHFVIRWTNEPNLKPKHLTTQLISILLQRIVRACLELVCRTQIYGFLWCRCYMAWQNLQSNCYLCPEIMMYPAIGKFTIKWKALLEFQPSVHYSRPMGHLHSPKVMFRSLLCLYLFDKIS